MPEATEQSSSAPAPASEPASAAPATEPASSSDAGFDIDSIIAPDTGYAPDSVKSSGSEPSSSPPQPPAASSPASPPAAPSVATPTPPAQPSQTPAASVAPAQPAGQPATAAAAPASATPAEPVETLEQHRTRFLPKLQELYALSDEEAEAVRTAPDKALPALAARLHYEVQMATHQAILSVLPDIVGGVLARHKESDAADTAFFDKWPKLKGDQHRDTVLSSIRAYRTANPKAPLDKVIEQAGIMAMISLGLPLEIPGLTSAAPVTPSMAAPVTPSMAPRPAGAGGAGHQAPRPPTGQAEDENIFAAIADAVVKGDI